MNVNLTPNITGKNVNIIKGATQADLTNSVNNSKTYRDEAEAFSIVSEAKSIEASYSALNASISSTTASDKATIATTKANEANNSAINASASEAVCIAKATITTDKANIAIAQAVIATNKALEASNSATTATDKALEASGSATIATDKAGEALTSAAQALGYRNEAEAFSISNVFIVYTIEDLVSIPSNHTTAIVKDPNRGGTFIWSATGTANGGTVFAGATGYWARQFSGAVNVKWFGAKGDGVTDDTDASNKACKFPKVIFPKGVYLTNIVLNNRIQIFGEGSTSTILKPYDNSKSIIRNAFVDTIWSYNSTVNGIGFKGSSKVGIGFAFGKDSHVNYQVNDEYCRNVTFNNCYFSDLEKAVYAPFGAIGETFNDCGFANNKYGLYALSNKFGGGTIMHAGNKYFNQGEFSGNDCAIYIHNTADGFGGVRFNSTIFERNKIASYIYSNSSYIPLEYNDVWFELNGSLLSVGTTTIDSWSGTTLSIQTLDNKTMYLDGSASIVLNGGRPTGIYPITDSCKIVSNNSTIAQASGNNGESFNFSSNSYFIFNNPILLDRFDQRNINKSLISNILSKNAFNVQISNSSINAANRILVKSCSVNNICTGFRDNLSLSNTCETSLTTGNGSFNLTGTVVTGGTIFNNVNQFTRANFGTAEYTSLSLGSLTTEQRTGFLFLSYDIRCMDGSVRTLSGDRASKFLLGPVTHYPDEGWKRISTIAYNDGTSFGYLIDFNGTGVTATWQIANVQLLRFSTLNEAMNYLNSNNYAKGI